MSKLVKLTDEVGAELAAAAEKDGHTLAGEIKHLLEDKENTKSIDSELYDKLEAKKDEVGAESITALLYSFLDTSPAPYMRKMSDYDLVEVLAGIDFPSESIPNPIAREMFIAFEDSPLWVDKQVYTNLVDSGGIEGAAFVLRKGFVCFRNYSYPTTDFKIMRIAEPITHFLAEKGVL